MDLDPAVIRDGLLIFILLLVSIIFHEWGHAIAADLLGDDTPRSEGRVTLDPRSHLDLVGTIIIPIINIFVLRGGFNFIGWGRPVSVNPSNFKNRNRDDILVSLAGPAANLAVALVAVIAGSLVVASQPRFGELVRGLVIMNVGLAVFNLIPIPPLDGGTVLRRLVGMSEETYRSISAYSGLVILILINLSVTQRFIGFLMDIACIPYEVICHSISPMAYHLIFS